MCQFGISLAFAHYIFCKFKNTKPHSMKAEYSQILDALMAQGFHKLQDANFYEFDYKITPYSLNTQTSFRFDSLDHFIAFLKLHQADSEKGIEVLHSTFAELGMNPKEFFWVNFF
jgi:hypothetical protein